MTQDEILRMAIKCQLVDTNNRTGIYVDALYEFANLVAQHEREECAKVCDSLNYNIEPNPEDCAEAIRARGQA